MPWGAWTPTKLRHSVRVLDSSMNTVEVETDSGRGYLKALGNREGEHALACELIGSSLAEWLGLATLDFTLVEVPTDMILYLDADETSPLATRRRAKPGPAFLSKAIPAVAWDGTPDDLARLDNPGAIAGLVVLDTWIGNPDRHPRRPPDTTISRWTKQNLDNVLLEILPRNRRRIVAMDFTVCLHCREGGLRSSYPGSLVRDDGIYGLFSEFEPLVTAASLLPFLDRLQDRGLAQHVGEAVARIPSEWQVDERTRDAVSGFLSARAAYLVDNLLTNHRRTVQCGPT